MSLGSRIRELRKRRGLTQRELAARLCIGQSAVSSLETGRTHLRAEDVPRLAEALGVSIPELFGENHAGQLPPHLGALVSDLPPQAMQELASFIEFLHKRYAKGQ